MGTVKWKILVLVLCSCFPLEALGEGGVEANRVKPGVVPIEQQHLLDTRTEIQAKWKEWQQRVGAHLAQKFKEACKDEVRSNEPLHMKVNYLINRYGRVYVWGQSSNTSNASFNYRVLLARKILMEGPTVLAFPKDAERTVVGLDAELHSDTRKGWKNGIPG